MTSSHLPRLLCFEKCRKTSSALLTRFNRFGKPDQGQSRAIQLFFFSFFSIPCSWSHCSVFLITWINKIENETLSRDFFSAEERTGVRDNATHISKTVNWMIGKRIEGIEIKVIQIFYFQASMFSRSKRPSKCSLLLFPQKPDFLARSELGSNWNPSQNWCSLLLFPQKPDFLARTDGLGGLDWGVMDVNIITPFLFFGITYSWINKCMGYDLWLCRLGNCRKWSHEQCFFLETAVKYIYRMLNRSTCRIEKYTS